MSEKRDVRIQGTPDFDLGCVSWIILTGLGGSAVASLVDALNAIAEAIRSLPQ